MGKYGKAFDRNKRTKRTTKDKDAYRGKADENSTFVFYQLEHWLKLRYSIRLGYNAPYVKILKEVYECLGEPLPEIDYGNGYVVYKSAQRALRRIKYKEGA